MFGQRTQLWWDLPVVESIEMVRHIYRVPAHQFRASRDELVELLDLEALLETPVRQLSLGQRVRADLAASLLHAPSILFLHEPTIGLDAVSKLAVRAFVKRLNRERGVTVILTTHDMDDIEALCERVISARSVRREPTCLFLGLVVLQATSTFWTIETLEVWNAFTSWGVTRSMPGTGWHRSRGSCSSG